MEKNSTAKSIVRQKFPSPTPDGVALRQSTSDYADAAWKQCELLERVCVALEILAGISPPMPAVEATVSLGATTPTSSVPSTPDEPESLVLDRPDRQHVKKKKGRRKKKSSAMRPVS